MSRGDDAAISTEEKDATPPQNDNNIFTAQSTKAYEGVERGRGGSGEESADTGTSMGAWTLSGANPREPPPGHSTNWREGRQDDENGNFDSDTGVLTNFNANGAEDICNGDGRNAPELPFRPGDGNLPNEESQLLEERHEGAIDARILLEEFLHSVVMPRMRPDGTLQEQRSSLPDSANFSSNVAETESRREKRWQSNFAATKSHEASMLDFEPETVQADIASLAKRLGLDIVILTVYVIVAYAMVFGAPWGFGVGIERSSGMASGKGLFNSVSPLRLRRLSSTDDFSDGSAADAQTFLREELEAESSQFTPRNAGLDISPSAPAPSSTRSASPGASHTWSTKELVGAVKQTTPTTNTPTTLQKTTKKPNSGKGGTSHKSDLQASSNNKPDTVNDEGSQRATGTLRISVDSPADFVEDRFFNHAFENTVSALTGVTVTQIFVKAYPEGPADVIVYFTVQFPAWSNGVDQFKSEWAGMSDVEIAGTLTAMLGELGSDAPPIKFLTASPLRTPADAEILNSLPSRLRFWVIWMGFLLAVSLAVKQAVLMAVFVWPLVHNPSFFVRDALLKLQLRLRSEVVRVAEESSTIERKGGRFLPESRQRPERFDHTAGGIVRDMSDAVWDIDASIDYTTIRPHWTDQGWRGLVVRFGAPMLALACVQLLCGLTGNGPFVGFYSSFATSYTSVDKITDSPLAPPLGTFKCASPGTTCRCAGSFYRGDRFENFADPTRKARTYECRNKAWNRGGLGLLDDEFGVGCFCDPFASNSIPATSNQRIVKLKFDIVGFSAERVCDMPNQERQGIERIFKESIAASVGAWVSPGHVHLKLRESKSLAFLVPPAAADADFLRNLIKENLRALKGLIDSKLSHMNGAFRSVKWTSSPVETLVSTGKEGRRTWACSRQNCGSASYQVWFNHPFLPCNGHENSELRWSTPLRAGSSQNSTLVRVLPGTVGAKFEVSLPTRNSGKLRLTWRDNTSDREIADVWPESGGPNLTYRGKDLLTCPQRNDWHWLCSVDGLLDFSLVVQVEVVAASTGVKMSKAVIDLSLSYMKISPCPGVSKRGCEKFSNATRVFFQGALENWRRDTNDKYPHAVAAWRAACRRAESYSDLQKVSACVAGMSLAAWNEYFPVSSASAGAFALADSDRDGLLEGHEFAAAVAGDGISRGVIRPTRMELQGGWWPDEGLLGKDVNILLVQLWTNAMLIVLFGIVLGGWPYTRYICNSAFEDMEFNLHCQLEIVLKSAFAEKYRRKLQRKANDLHTQKMRLGRSREQCRIM